MTNFEPRGAPRTGRDVWTLPGYPGYLDSIQAAGGVAAPLLAGASFTLAALVMQASTPFARWPDLALGCFVAAGLAQVFAVQSVVWARRYMMTPDDLRQWFPNDFGHDELPTAWLRNVQWSGALLAQTWARRTTRWVNAGLALLLAGVAASVVPPGHISGPRWAVIVVACAGVFVETGWVTTTMVPERLRQRLVSCLAVAAVAGAAIAAWVLAGLSWESGMSAAAWWAIALTVILAVPLLANVSGLRFRRGRLRYSRPPLNAETAGGGIAAMIPPVTFLAALYGAGGVLRKARYERLADLYPVTARLLPVGVSIGTHHRALSRCQAVTAAAGEFDGLLAESRSVLGDVQPTSQALAERARQAPGCVVRVVDRHESQAPFGYFIVYPLQEEAVRRIEDGQLIDGSQLKPDDLAAPDGASAGSYVSVIWAPGAVWTRRCVIATLVESLAATRADGTTRPFFARPATDRGRWLMQRYGFTAVRDEKNIWALR